MRAVVLAYHEMGCVGIERLLANGFEIAAVFTHADRAGEQLWFRSVAEVSAGHGLPVFAPEDINHPLSVERIRALKPDILFSFYYRELIGPALLDVPPAGCLNMHGSLLPRYRGCAPANWAILNGETETGVTLHYMTTAPDAGDIVCQHTVPITREDDGRSLNLKLAVAAGPMLDEYLPAVRSGSAPRVPQRHDEATYFGRRSPDDGEIDWATSAADIENLARAVTRPYAGAFTYSPSQRVMIWKASARQDDAGREPGTIVSVRPLEVACGSGTLRVDFAQRAGGVYCRGEQLAADMNLVVGLKFGEAPENRARKPKTRVLILGVNGFIGNFLSERLLEDGAYEVHGMDLHDSAIERFTSHPDFYFHEGDISIHREWIEYHVKTCDVVVPLVAIATPIEYTRNPIRVFELDFEENIRIVRYCVDYGKRLVFPSTSEVYGMCDDDEFDEDRSRLILGPINKQRWIYSACKQLLDRVIWAYGQKHGLRFTLFRPFNWIGPRLDSLESARIGSSRAITQLILNLVEGLPLQLVDGGAARRCFTDVSEGIDGLMRIIKDPKGVCNGKILNIGNPNNEASIRELAEMLVHKFERHPLRGHFPPFTGMQELESRAYYGEGYQDMEHRRPSIRNARKLLGWEPVIPLDASVERTLDFFLREYLDRASFVDGQVSQSTPDAAGSGRARAVTP